MFRKSASLLFLGIGVFLLVQIAMPLVAFKVWELVSYDQSQSLLDPQQNALADDRFSNNVLGVSVSTVDDFPAFIGSSGTTNLAYKEFNISVSRIKLSNQKVVVASNDLDQNLAHFPGSALPGERGNVFVSGHSSISLLLFSKERRPIFANLQKLKANDLIEVAAANQNFTYKVIGMKVVDPKDISVLNPPDSEGRYLTLMTCVPPGFNTKRLVVLAKLI